MRLRPRLRLADVHRVTDEILAAPPNDEIPPRQDAQYREVMCPSCACKFQIAERR